MIRKLIYFVIIILVISACKKEIKFDISENDRKLVVNGVFNVGDPIVLWISKSKGLLEQSRTEAIDNVGIKIYENGVLDTNSVLHIPSWIYYNYVDSGISKIYGEYKRTAYLSNLLISQDKTYKLEISTPGIDNKSFVEFKVPNLVPILKLDTTASISTDQSPGNVQFDMLIQDPPNEENFYVIQIQEIRITSFKDPYGEINRDTIPYYQPIEINDIVLSNNSIQLPSGVLFNDKMFNGKLQHLKFKGYSPYYFTFKYYIMLRSISKDYYNYLASLGLYYNSVDNPIAEPVSVISNVKNGFGIVTAVNQWVDSLPVIYHEIIMKNGKIN